MIKGTTPTHIFKIPLKADEIKTVEITYSQSDKEVLQKCTKDCLIEDEVISVMLTQEETLKFNHRYKVQFQLRILTTSNVALSSKVIHMDAEQCLSEDVLV